MLGRIKIFLVCAAVSLSAALLAGDSTSIDRIVTEGKTHSQVVKQLNYLGTVIGPRTTGTPQLGHAQAWAMGKLRGWGLKNVHLEKWGEVPVGWERGPRQSAKMLLPYEKDFAFSTPCWTPGTEGPVKGQAKMEPESLEDLQKNKADYKGAWMIMKKRVGMRGPALKNLTPLEAAEDAAGIAGRVYGTNDKDLVWTHGSWAGIDNDHLPNHVLVTLNKRDHDSIIYSLEKNRNVVLQFDIENHFKRGPVPVYNVVADLRGTEFPDEMVILSAHFDSWNGPGSQGASDNGTGSMVMMEAMRILSAIGAKPKRTIRLCLWSGEEQGLLGSKGYVQLHKDELPKISAVLNDDGGSNYEGGMAILADWKPVFDPLVATMNAAFPTMPMKLDVVTSISGGGGSDHASFNAVGVPGLEWYETGKQNYMHVWHTQYDRVEETIPEYLVQSATNSAVAAYMIADADTMLPRKT